MQDKSIEDNHKHSRDWSDLEVIWLNNFYMPMHGICQYMFIWNFTTIEVSK